MVTAQSERTPGIDTSTDKTFADPIGEMLSCHGKILAQMELVEAMCREIADDGIAGFDRRAKEWSDTITFIRERIGAHSRDEEEGLFPMVRHELGSAVELMKFEHSWISQSEEVLFGLYESLARHDIQADSSRVQEFRICAAEIAFFYKAHIGVENEALLLPAQGILTRDQKMELQSFMLKNRERQVAGI